MVVAVVVLMLQVKLVLDQELVEPGKANTITNSSVTYAGGGAGGNYPNGSSSGGAGGGGSSGPGVCNAGTDNTGGGGGAGFSNTGSGGAGGSGIVVVRFPGSTCAAVAPGTNSIATLPSPAGGCKVASFTVSGTLTIS